MKLPSLWFLTILATVPMTAAFAPPAGRTLLSQPPAHLSSFQQPLQQQQLHFPPSLQRQRRSVTSVQTMGLFGLGVPEIAIIVIAAAFLLGPQALGEMAKETGKMASSLKDELKDVPVEFQKGLEEGEMEARSRKAKKIKPVKEEEDA